MADFFSIWLTPAPVGRVARTAAGTANEYRQQTGVWPARCPLAMAALPVISTPLNFYGDGWAWALL